MIWPGSLSLEDRRRLFPNMGIKEIRCRLKEMGLDSHMPIEFLSTEVCILTAKGILLQIRATDNAALGMWGGLIENDETPIECAKRELHEELGLELPKEQFKFMEINRHMHYYANGDKAIFETYRFVGFRSSF